MPISAAVRAERIRRKIDRWPTSVVFTKPRVVQANGTVTPETALPAQSVRITSDSRASAVGGEAGDAPRHALVVFGTLDNDIAVGYTFEFDNEVYRVTKAIPVPGGVQALATT